MRPQSTRCFTAAITPDGFYVVRSRAGRQRLHYCTNCTHLNPGQSRDGLARRRSVIAVKYGGGTRRLPLDWTNKYEGFDVLPMLLHSSDMPSLDRLPYGETDKPFPHVKPFGVGKSNSPKMRRLGCQGPSRGRGPWATERLTTKVLRVSPKFPQLPAENRAHDRRMQPHGLVLGKVPRSTRGRAARRRRTPRSWRARSVAERRRALRQGGRQLPKRGPAGRRPEPERFTTLRVPLAQRPPAG